MGAWGHDYFDNDGAQDLICALREVVGKQLATIINRKKFDSSYYEEVIAASALVAEQGGTCGVSFPPITESPYRFFDLAEPAAQKIEKIIGDESYISQWDSPQAKNSSLIALACRLRFMVEDRTARDKKRAARFRQHKRRRKPTKRVAKIHSK